MIHLFHKEKANVRIRKQCKNCLRTFYEPGKNRVLLVDEYTKIDCCPHCGSESFIKI